MLIQSHSSVVVSWICFSSCTPALLCMKLKPPHSRRTAAMDVDDVLLDGDVALQELRGAAGGDDLARDALAVGDVDVADEDGGALGREQLRRLLAQARTRRR